MYILIVALLCIITTITCNLFGITSDWGVLGLYSILNLAFLLFCEGAY